MRVRSVRLILKLVHVLVRKAEVVSRLVHDHVMNQIFEVDACLLPFPQQRFTKKRDGRGHVGMIPDRFVGQRSPLVQTGKVPAIIDAHRFELLRRREVCDAEHDIGQVFAKMGGQSGQGALGHCLHLRKAGQVGRLHVHRPHISSACRHSRACGRAAELPSRQLVVNVTNKGRASMTNSTDIFDRLKKDHDRHRDLLDQMAETKGETDRRKKLLEEFTREVKSHAAAEEQALYSTMLRKPPTTDETRHSVAEHHELNEALNDLAATEMSSDEWMQKFKQLDHDYRHHIDEEEDDHFPDFEKHLTPDDEQHMRAVFDRRKKAEHAAAEVTPEKKEDAKE